MLELRQVRLKPDAAAINQRFDSGRVHVVLGGNHSGKSRLCRVIAGLDPPAAVGPDGGIELAGRSIAHLSPGRRPVALVYQAFVNYPNWTVAQNIASPLVAARADAAVIKARVAELAARVALDGYLDRYPHTLSGGQQQRLAIARALAKSAEVLVLDEPLVNLDYKLREALEVELRGLLAELGLTVIYTSSDPREAFALADELVLLDDHTVLQSGPPLTVYEAPVSALAADLMSDPRANRLREAGGILMVRPEHLSLAREAPDDVTFAVEVLGTETNGSETFLHCRLQSDTSHAHWIARIPGLEAPATGVRCELYAAASSLMRFPEPPGG